MGWLAALLSLGFTLLGRRPVHCGGEDWRRLRFLVKRQTGQVISFALWKPSALAFSVGIVAGQYS